MDEGYDHTVKLERLELNGSDKNGCVSQNRSTEYKYEPSRPNEAFCIIFNSELSRVRVRVRNHHQVSLATESEEAVEK